MIRGCHGKVSRSLPAVAPWGPRFPNRQVERCDSFGRTDSESGSLV